MLLLKEWKLIDGENLAIDSFKIRAQNSLKNNFDQKKVDRHIDFIDEKIVKYHQQLNQAEGQEEKAVSEDKIADQKTKKEKYQAIENELEKSGQAQLSTTDPDARSVVLHRNIINVGYNIRAGCDAKHKLSSYAQTGDVNDTHALAPMALGAKKLLKLDTLKTGTDMGYTAAAELAQCADNGITTYSSPKEHSVQKNGLFNRQVFKYNAQEDTYLCPAENTLVTHGSIYQKVIIG